MPGNVPKRVFVLANRVELTLDALPLGRHYWIKGLIRAGCDVQTFNYQDALIHNSPAGNKALARLFYKRRVNELLVSQVRSYHPDVVLILGMRLKDAGAETLAALRTAAPDCVFMGWDCECYPRLDAIRQKCARKMNIVLTTGGGRLLRDYQALGVECCAYMPNVCDPDIHYRYDVDDLSRTDILFTGKSNSPKHPFNRERHEILTRLAQMPNARLCGCFGRAAVRGLDYFRLISGARIGLSINFVNDVRLYHSDRLTHYTACGTFTLAKRVPDTDLLFQDKVHVRYFDSPDEFFELADWYLRHDEERDRIARAGMEHAHREFNCERMAHHLLDLVAKGRIDAPWAETACVSEAPRPQNDERHPRRELTQPPAVPYNPASTSPSEIARSKYQHIEKKADCRMKTKRILLLGNIENLSLDTITRGRHYWVKGFIRLGCDVQIFSYRHAISRSRPLGSRGLARFLSRRKVDGALLAQARSYRPDIVLIAGMRLKDVSGELLAAMRSVASHAAFVGMEHDWLPELDPIRAEIARHMDFVLATSAGSFLETYKAAGAPRCAYMPNSCDPDLQYRYDVGEEWKSGILWTGKARHDKVPPNPEREAVLTRLAQRTDARLYGCLGRPRVYGLDYFRAISGARIALSFNMVNDVRLYHSNRFINNVACGAFTLARRVPDADLLFQDGVHVRYFDTIDEFFHLADWYLAHDQERERIARAGMDHAHKEFNCRRMAQHLLDLVEKGRIDAPWAEII